MAKRPAAIELDEAWALVNCSDVKDAIKRGIVPWDGGHYVLFGTMKIACCERFPANNRSCSHNQMLLRRLVRFGWPEFAKVGCRMLISNYESHRGMRGRDLYLRVRGLPAF